MKENMADSVVYWPPTGGEAITSALSEIEGVVNALHEPYDSIKRNIWNAIPHKLKGADNSSVTVSFKEDRFYKDGTQESLRIIDRIFIDEENIFGAIEITNKLSVNDGNDKNEDDPIPIFTDDDSKLLTFLTSLVGRGIYY